MNTPAHPIDLDTQQDTVQGAEDAFLHGLWVGALAAYTGLLHRMLALHRTTGRAFCAADLVVIERLTHLAKLSHQCDAAGELLHTMAGLSRDAGNFIVADYAQLQCAEMHIASGDVQAASAALGELTGRMGALPSITFSQEGVAAWERGTAWQALPSNDRALLLTCAHGLLGRILTHQGRYGDALAMLERGLQHARQAGAPDLARRASPVLGLARAQALLERGDLDAAARQLTRSESDFHGTLSPAGQIHANALWGRCHVLRGDMGNAVRRLERASALCEAHGLARAGAECDLNLAHCYVLLNRVSDALAMVTRVTALAASLGDTALAARAGAIHAFAVAQCSSSAEAVSVELSITDMLARQVARPQGPTTQAVPAAFEGTSHRSGFLTNFEERVLACRRTLVTDTAAAAVQFDALEASTRHTDSALVRIGLRVLGARLQWARGDVAGAVVSWAAAIPVLASLGLHPQAWQCHQWLAEALRRLGRLTEAAVVDRQADAELDRLAGSLEAGSRRLYLLDKASAGECLMAARVDALVRLQETLRTAAWPRRWRLRWQLMVGLQDLLHHLERHRTARGGRLAAPGPHWSAGPRSRLARWFGCERERAELVYVVLPDRLLAVWTSGLAMGLVVSPVTRVTLREHVRHWHEFARGAATAAYDAGLHSARQQQDDTGRQLAEHLGSALMLDTVLSALPVHVRRLTIVADEMLHGVPFAALPYRDRYLVEHFSLSMGRSGADSVLASSWPAVEALSGPFMQRFHAALAHLPRDAALREVQLAFIANDTTLEALVNRPVDAPFFWAGFTLSGAPGHVPGLR